MHVGYSCLAKNVSTASKRLMVVIGLLAMPITMRLEKISAAPKPKPLTAKPQTEPLPVKPATDLRTVRLSNFLSKLHCPVSELAEDFIHAADDNQLDWRLLPSISVI